MENIRRKLLRHIGTLMCEVCDQMDVYGYVVEVDDILARDTFAGRLADDAYN